MPDTGRFDRSDETIDLDAQTLTGEVVTLSPGEVEREALGYLDPLEEHGHHQGVRALPQVEFVGDGVGVDGQAGQGDDERVRLTDRLHDLGRPVCTTNQRCSIDPDLEAATLEVVHESVHLACVRARS